MDSMTFPRGRPSIGIIPLGTGNDLSRSLNWGGKYKSKPLKKFLMDIGKADKVTMDRWTLKATVDPSRIEKSSNADTKLVCQINNFVPISAISQEKSLIYLAKLICHIFNFFFSV